jgi:exonuclease III
MKFLSWNTAKRLKRTEEQFRFILNQQPDVIALQEILPSTEQKYRSLIANLYPNIISSFDLAPNKTILKGKRMFGQLIASKVPFTSINPQKFDVPWKERVLSVTLSTPTKIIDFHTTHIPPGTSNGWVKISMIEGIVKTLINSLPVPQILCGDFNTPQAETKEYGIVTFGQRIKASGEPVLYKKFRGGTGIDWDKGERLLFDELGTYEIVDSFRRMQPNTYESYSWSFTRKGKRFRRRFDHFFASKELKVKECAYLNFQGNLSDHSPIVCKYDLG